MTIPVDESFGDPQLCFDVLEINLGDLPVSESSSCPCNGPLPAYTAVMTGQIPILACTLSHSGFDISALVWTAESEGHGAGLRNGSWDCGSDIDNDGRLITQAEGQACMAEVQAAAAAQGVPCTP